MPLNSPFYQIPQQQGIHLWRKNLGNMGHTPSGDPFQPVKIMNYCYKQLL